MTGNIVLLPPSAAMKRLAVGLWILAMALLMVACSLVERYRVVSKPNPLEASEDNVSAGASLFNQHCAICHGPDGRGDGPGRGDLPVSDLIAIGHKKDGVFAYYIQYGKNEGMPAFKDVLSEDQVYRVVHYLRAMQDLK